MNNEETTFEFEFNDAKYKYDKKARSLYRNGEIVKLLLLPHFQFRLTFENFCKRYERENY